MIDTRSSRMTKKSRIDSESVLVREIDILSVIAPSAEPIIALSALTMLSSIEVPSVRVETARDEDATPEPSATPLARVRAESAAVVELAICCHAGHSSSGTVSGTVKLRFHGSFE